MTLAFTILALLCVYLFARCADIAKQRNYCRQWLNLVIGNNFGGKS